MREILHRFSVQSAKFNAQVWICALIIWLIVLACAISSIIAQPYTKRQRTFWLLVVICIPIIGLLAYLPFSFRKEDLPHIFLLRGQKDPKKRQR